MGIDKNATIGLLHPGMMGISVGATIKNSGYRVVWVSEGRSDESHARANEHGLEDVGTLADLCEQSQVIVSVCPPHAAEDVGDTVIQAEFSGYFVDGNAIAPQKAIRIGEKMAAAGIDFVDGSIIGGPAWQPNRTWLYLSGEKANEVQPIFEAGPLETEVIGAEIGKASALKMCFAANTKGTTALLSAVVAAAESLGVRKELEQQWIRYDPKATEEAHQRVQRVTQKAWRFAGEMEEIAATFKDAGLPDGFHRGAFTVYERMAHLKGREDLPDLMEVLAALIGDEGE